MMRPSEMETMKREVDGLKDVLAYFQREYPDGISGSTFTKQIVGRLLDITEVAENLERAEYNRSLKEESRV